MKRLLIITAVALLTYVCTSMAFDMVDPAATSGNTTYSATDNFGDILGTIPSSNPGPSNAWVGMGWANGYLYQLKNIASPVSTAMLQVNPSTGAVMNTYTMPFSGYSIGFQYDGSGFWVVQWSPINMIYKVSTTGTLISQFSPNVTPYSARSIGFDGTNLLVGCDQSANVTQLVKFSTSGTNMQTWATGSAVGWFMDGEVCADAPTGANYYVVDNVGNSIKRLNIGVTVTVAAQVNSPATSPDVAEGIAYDGDNLWHCGAYSSQGLIWKLDDGFTVTPPALTVTMTPISPPIVIPAGGGTFSFNASVINAGPQVPFWVWARIKNPDNTYTAPTVGPVMINPPIATLVTRMKSQSVPASWASGLYYYIGYGNTSVGYPAIDADSFSWTKSAVAGNGPIVWEAVTSGEMFPGEVAHVSAPTSFNVAGAFPNPFNPTTTISFTLPEASRVTLNVYDMNGRQVAQLVNGLRDAGSHQVTFDGSNLASGLYMYTLSNGHNIATGKLALVK